MRSNSLELAALFQTGREEDNSKMTQEDLEKASNLAQESKETRYLAAQTRDDMKAAHADVKTFKLDVSNGKPGARLELDAATKRAEELEARAKTLDERLLSITEESGNLGKWDMQARSLAREYRLNDEQMEKLFELLKAGKTRAEVQRAAQLLQKADDSAKAPQFAFQGANDVSW